MARPEILKFHKLQKEDELYRAGVRFQYGTSTTGQKNLQNRIQNFDIFTLKMPPNPKGGVEPFPNSINQLNNLSFSGGIRTQEGSKIISKRLKDRAYQSEQLNALKAGFELDDKPIPILTPLESASLELNNLLNALNDAIDNETFGDFEVRDLPKIQRLFLQVSPYLTADELNELLQIIVNNKLQFVEIFLPRSEDQRQLSKKELANARIINKFNNTLMEQVKKMITVSNKSVKDKILVVRSLAKGLKVEIPEKTETQFIEPKEVKVEEEDDDEDEDVEPGVGAVAESKESDAGAVAESTGTQVKKGLKESDTQIKELKDKILLYDKLLELGEKADTPREKANVKQAILNLGIKEIKTIESKGINPQLKTLLIKLGKDKEKITKRLSRLE